MYSSENEFVGPDCKGQNLRDENFSQRFPETKTDHAKNKNESQSCRTIWLSFFFTKIQEQIFSILWHSGWCHFFDFYVFFCVEN